MDAPETLERFFRAILVSRLDTRTGRLLVTGLAGLVAIVAVNDGIGPAAGLLGSLAALIGIVIVWLERDRWSAQDVVVRFRAQRRVEWLRDTGTEATRGSPAESEVWLGVHRRGTVPQRYRAIIAGETRDPVTAEREFAALPDASPLDRATREQLLRSRELQRGQVPDLTTIRGLVAELPESDERRMFQTWIAQASSFERFGQGDRDWLRPLLLARAVVPRPSLPIRWHLGLWVSRFAPVIALAGSSVVLSAIGLSLAGHGERLPASYADTTLATRGDLPAGFDSDRVWRTLPEVERAIPAATRIQTSAISADDADFLIEIGSPSVIWTIEPLDLELEVRRGWAGNGSTKSRSSWDRPPWAPTSRSSRSSDGLVLGTSIGSTPPSLRTSDRPAGSRRPARRASGRPSRHPTQFPDI